MSDRLPVRKNRLQYSITQVAASPHLRMIPLDEQQDRHRAVQPETQGDGARTHTNQVLRDREPDRYRDRERDQIDTARPTHERDPITRDMSHRNHQEQLYREPHQQEQMFRDVWHRHHHE